MIRYTWIRLIDHLAQATEGVARQWCRLRHKRTINWSVYGRLYYTCGECHRQWEIR